MVNTRLEAAIEGMHEDTLEQLADDLLTRKGYDVDPTSTIGADNGRDSILTKDDELGILHCSTNNKLENKIKDDAESAAERDEEFDFFLFFTNANRATVMRDRLEEEVEEEYGFRTRIRDFEYLRNELMGNPDNHDLAREHLSVYPAGLMEDIKTKLEELDTAEDLEKRQNRPRITVDKWGVTSNDELVPLTAPEGLEKTQNRLSFSLTNFGNGDAYELRTCLYVKWIDDLSAPPIQEIETELKSAEPTSVLRREGRGPEDDPQNYLEVNSSTNFNANTFIRVGEKKSGAFGAAATGPFAPGTTPP